MQQDKWFQCRDCGGKFVFSQSEQAFYAEKGLLHEPQRCPTCRINRRREKLGQPRRQMYEVVCAACGTPTVVPFLPRNERPVYCSSCFEHRRVTAGQEQSPVTAP
jgi:CxxC-x17-CxxC domain-containing protein